MSKAKYNNLLFFIILISSFFLASCAELEYDSLSPAEPAGNQGYDPSDGPFKLALAKNDITSYRKFIHNHPTSRYLPQAINNLGELLVEEGKKENLEAFVKSFPEYEHKVSKALDEIKLIENVNRHMGEDNTLHADRRDIQIRKGEVFFGHHYFKGFVKLEDSMGMDAEYEIRIDKLIAPEFVYVVLIQGSSFAMEESFHALTNIRYKIYISETAPAGKYKADIIFGVYRKEDGEWKRRDGSGVTHEIEAMDNQIEDANEPRVDLRAINYFMEKKGSAEQILRHLVPPNKEDFGERYMYAYNMADYSVLVEKYQTFQAIALYHLQKAAKSNDPAVRQTAEQALLQTNYLSPDLKFTPYNNLNN